MYIFIGTDCHHKKDQKWLFLCQYCRLSGQNIKHVYAFNALADWFLHQYGGEWSSLVGHHQSSKQAEPKTQLISALQGAHLWNAVKQQWTHHNQANAINQRDFRGLGDTVQGAWWKGFVRHQPKSERQEIGQIDWNRCGVNTKLTHLISSIRTKALWRVGFKFP